MNARGQWAGVACLLLAAMSWGAGFAVGKAAMTQVDAYHLTTIRYGVAMLAFIGWLLYSEGPRALHTEGRPGLILLLGVVGIGGGVLLMFIGLHRTRAEHAAVIVAAQPLMAALLSWTFRGLRPAPRTMFAIGLALAGVALVVTRGDPASLAHASGSSVSGDLMVLGAALCWVTYTLAAAAFPAWSSLRYTAHTVTTGVVFCIASTAVALALGAASIPTPAQLLSVGWEIAFITIGSALLGTLGWHIGIRRIGESGVLFINFVPVTAFAIGVAQGYRFNWAEVTGAVLVIGGLLASRMGKTPAPAAGAGKQCASAIDAR